MEQTWNVKWEIQGNAPSDRGKKGTSQTKAKSVAVAKETIRVRVSENLLGNKCYSKFVFISTAKPVKHKTKRS